MKRWALWLERLHLKEKSVGSFKTQMMAALEFQSQLPGFSNQSARCLLRGQAELLRDAQSISRVLKLGLALSDSVRKARLQKINEAA